MAEPPEILVIPREVSLLLLFPLLPTNVKSSVTTASAVKVEISSFFFKMALKLCLRFSDARPAAHNPPSLTAFSNRQFSIPHWTALTKTASVPQPSSN